MCYCQWYDDTSLFYLQWNVGISPSVERWCILLYDHRQWYVDVFLFNTFSGKLVCVIVSGTTIHLFSTSSGTLVSHLQWNIGVFCYMIIVSGTSMYLSLIP